jgi:capsular polysaccharide biosynthesis protein
MANLVIIFIMFHILRKHLTLIVIWGLVFALLSAFGSLFFPKQYSAISQVLIISRDKTGADPYTQARSAEKIGANLAQIMDTTDFYNKVINNASMPFDREPWKNLTDRQQRKKWTKDVQASMLYGVNVMNVKVYAKDQAEAANLSNAVSQTLVSQGWEYLGGDVAIKLISEPLASSWPVRPNILLNAVLGFLIGGLISSLWVLRYKKHNLFGG